MPAKRKFKPGFYWHVHHKRLVEWCYDYYERVRHIRTQKDSRERPLRLRLLRPVQNMPKSILRAHRALIRADQAHDRANDRFWRISSPQRERALDRAKERLSKAEKVFELAFNVDKRVIERLHKNQCPNCPWDGDTIFPKPKKRHAKKMAAKKRTRSRRRR